MGITITETRVQDQSSSALNIKDIINIADNLTTTDSGKVLDARQGKVLNDQISAQGKVLNDRISAMRANIIDIIYPVGSYYWSSNATSPSELFGGTWEQIKDRFILAAGDSYSVGSSGGEASHTLSADEIPSHSHSITFYNDDFSNGGDSETNINRKRQSPGLTYDVAWKKGAWQYSSNATGGNVAHNNMPPYITAYCWHRVA